MSKSIVMPQKVAPTYLDTHEEQLERKNVSPEQEGFVPHLPTGAYSSLNCPTAAILSSIPNCLTSRNPVLLAPSLPGEIFIDQITGDIYTKHIYDSTNKLFISTGEKDHDMAEDFQRLLRKQKWSKFTTLGWKC